MLFITPNIRLRLKSALIVISGFLNMFSLALTVDLFLLSIQVVLIEIIKSSKRIGTWKIVLDKLAALGYRSVEVIWENGLVTDRSPRRVRMERKLRALDISQAWLILSFSESLRRLHLLQLWSLLRLLVDIRDLFISTSDRTPVSELPALGTDKGRMTVFLLLLFLLGKLSLLLAFDEFSLAPLEIRDLGLSVLIRGFNILWLLLLEIIRRGRRFDILSPSGRGRHLPRFERLWLKYIFLVQLALEIVAFLSVLLLSTQEVLLLETGVSKRWAN